MTDAGFASNRRRLLTLGIAGLTACTTRSPKVADKPPPSKLVLAPVTPYGKVYVYLPSNPNVLFVGKTPYVIQSTQGSESALSRKLTDLLAQQRLAAVAHLHDALMTALQQQGSSTALPKDAVLAADAVKRWKFAALRPEADTVLYAEVQELSFWVLDGARIFPLIKSTMTLISAVDDDELGVARYSVRPDADRSNPRALLPRAGDRFDNLDQLFADPSGAARTLTSSLERIAQVMATDVLKVQRRETIAWD
ncbi:MAG: hypothetical protein AB7G13_21975 [Lautropia sp.]